MRRAITGKPISEGDKDGGKRRLTVKWALALTVIGLSMWGLLAFLGEVLAGARHHRTQERMDAIITEMVQYAAAYGHLPCPDLLQTGNQHRGDDGMCFGDQSRGTVPYRELGMDREDALDGYRNFITYRVDPVLAAFTKDAPLSLNMMMCETSAVDTGGMVDSCAPGVHPAMFTRGRGLIVENERRRIADPQNSTGAAFVLISHGRDERGACRDQDRMTPPAIGDDAPNDCANPVANDAKTAYSARSSGDDELRSVKVGDMAVLSGWGPDIKR
ncbi:MAG: hypothetical protein HQL41_00070 [Alphaproteobacteria bacterium]|nr:hypothetical protein [Alphaproteobacteria bacterium]